MVRITPSIFMGGSSSGSDTDTVQMSGADSTPTMTRTSSGTTQSGNFGRWIANSSSSLTITLSASDLEMGDVMMLGGVGVSVYQPSVSISGGGNVSESISEYSAFTVTGDLPDSWIGTPLYDDPIPDTVVSLDYSGTATPGNDYENLPETVTISQSGTVKSISFKPINDEKPEGYGTPDDGETVIATVRSSQSYQTPLPPSLPAVASLVLKRMTPTI
ncbi:MAG: hypothetical protein QM754_02625 [Tepidisphaeraceae bacterium]